MSRREEILAAAKNAFLKFGIEKITLEDIARECGVQKTALYYYFRNKDEILAEMLAQKMDEFSKTVKEQVMKGEDIKDRLRIYMRSKIRLMRDNLPFINLFEKESLPQNAKLFLKEHKTKIFNEEFDLIKHILKQGIRNKKVSYELNDSLVLMILGVTYGTFIGRFMENTDWDTDTMIETTIDVIFKGIE